MFRFIGSWCLLWLMSLSLLAQTTQIHFLSGTDKDNAAQWDFRIDKGRKSGSWQKINVPSCWETEGFGEYSFGASASDEKAVYKHQFIALPNWQGKQVNLVFEGVLTDAEVKLNGKVLGIHRGGYEQFSFDISALLQFGATNELEVTADKRGADVKNDTNLPMWIFGGIYRPVYLEVLPSIHIKSIAIDTRASGYLQAQITVNQPNDVQIKAYLQDLQGNPVGTLLQSNTRKTFTDNSTGFELSGTFGGVQVWSSESPQRYRFVVELQDKQGKVLHRISNLIGFRTVALKEDGVYVNDKKVKLQGVNYRAFWHESGISIDRQISELDGLLLKELNINTIYNKFYPPDGHLLDICDSLGLYVVYTLPTGSSPEATIQRDMNHPSVILLTAPSTLTARPVISAAALPELPVNSMRVVNDATFKKAWQTVLGGKQTGLFLPYFADELFKSENGTPVQNPATVNAGIVNAYRERTPVFHAVKEWWAPLQLSSDSPDGCFKGTLTATNRFTFTNLNRCKFVWQLADIGNPLGGESSEQIKADGTAFPPNIAPGVTDKLVLNLPSNWQEHDLLVVTAFAPTGNEIYSWRFPITSPERHIPQLLLGDFAEVAQARKTNDSWELSGGDVKVNIHPSGHISQIKLQNKILKINGLSFKEPPTEVIENQKGVLTFRFPASSPVQTVSYAVSDAGILRIQYTGREIGLSGIESLQEISAFAAGPLPQDLYAGAPLGLSQQKNPVWQGTYRNLYWAKIRAANLPLTLMAATDHVSLHLAPEGQLIIAHSSATDSGANAPLTVTLFLKAGE